MTAPAIPGGSQMNVTPTPLGSNNSNPQLSLTQSTGPNVDGYNPGNNNANAANNGKYAT